MMKVYLCVFVKNYIQSVIAQISKPYYKNRAVAIDSLYIRKNMAHMKCLTLTWVYEIFVMDTEP